jgi:hypothetical protein
MEIEAKFAVPDEATWLKLQAVEQIDGYALSLGETKQVYDTFVDTPDRAILASRHVCRKREMDGHIVMTLKSGQSTVHRNGVRITLSMNYRSSSGRSGIRSVVEHRWQCATRAVIRSASNAHHPVGHAGRSDSGRNECG